MQAASCLVVDNNTGMKEAMVLIRKDNLYISAFINLEENTITFKDYSLLVLPLNEGTIGEIMETLMQELLENHHLTIYHKHLCENSMTIMYHDEPLALTV